MTDYANPELESTAAERDLSDRDVRALTQYLTVVPEAPGLYSVSSQSGAEYIVDPDMGRCTCEDHRNRHVRCKHIRRVEYETGREPLPEWIDRDALPSDFGRHVESEQPSVITDGGTQTQSPYTVHTEPPREGGKQYHRCRTCGAELLTQLGGFEKLVHKPDCPHAEW